MVKRSFAQTITRNVRNLRWNADAHLRSQERSVVIKDDVIASIHTCQLAANNPIEDFYSVAKCLSSNAYLVGVYDGHGGPQCSRHISTNLYPYVCASVLKKHQIANLPLDQRLEWMLGSTDVHHNQFIKPDEGNIIRYHKKFLEDTERRTFTVREALASAFNSCDEDMSKAALPNARGYIDRASVRIAASGSCAIMAHVREGHLHVANSGDAEAVLGVSCANGGVTSRQLSRAHNADNPEEVQRIRSQHPTSESQILRGGRLLGELLPLRAFGDVRYKWPYELQKVVLEPLGNIPPQNLCTPPYLTVTPQVFYHKLNSKDKFMVLASDGLWEWLDPDAVVRLVHDHTLGAMTLQPFQPANGMNLKQVLSELSSRQSGAKEHKTPIDENCATHIIRHALGGVSGGSAKQYERLADLLQMPPGKARNYRDDITVIVVHFNEEYLEKIQHEEEAENI